MAARVTVVIPNRDGRELLPEVLDALAAQTHTDFRCVVADDGSQDDSRDLARRHPLGPEVVEVRDGPRGFGAAANAGIRQASGSEYVALLNNDAVPDPDWLEQLVAALDARPGFAWAASRVRFLYSPELLDSAGDGVAACGQPFRRGHRSADGEDWDRPVEVLAASAAAALYRRPLLLDLGGFDEDFEAVYEDVDLGWRGYARGYRGLYAPRARVRHRSGATLGRGRRAFYLDQRNRVWLMVKNMPAGTWLKAAPSYLALESWGFLVAARRGLASTWLRARWHALRGLGPWLEKRQREQLACRRTRRELEAALDWGWLGSRLRARWRGRPVVDAFEFGAVLS